jgi:hypothetical protein
VQDALGLGGGGGAGADDDGGSLGQQRVEALDECVVDARGGMGEVAELLDQAP